MSSVVTNYHVCLHYYYYYYYYYYYETEIHSANTTG